MLRGRGNIRKAPAVIRAAGCLSSPGRRKIMFKAICAAAFAALAVSMIPGPAAAAPGDVVVVGNGW